MRRLALVLVAACGSRDPGMAVVTHDARVERVAVVRDAAVEIPYVGVIAASESVDIAPRFEGVVAKVLVRVGDPVAAGQIVAEMDPRSMQEEQRAAEAALGAAQAAYRQAAVDLEDAKRKRALEQHGVEQGVTAATVLEEAKLAVKRFEAALEKARSTVAAETSHLQTARTHVTDTALRAPTNGTVAIRFRDDGATVAAGAPILRIVEKGELRLRFAVAPERAHDFGANTKLAARIDTIAAPVTAIVRQVAPTIDPASGMIIVEAELAPESEVAAELRPGLAAWVARIP